MRNRLAIAALLVLTTLSVAWSAHAQGPPRRRQMRQPPGSHGRFSAGPPPSLSPSMTLDLYLVTSRAEWQSAWKNVAEADPRARTFLIQARSLLDRAYFIRDDHSEQSMMYARTAMRLIRRSQRASIADATPSQRVTIVLREADEMVIRLRVDRFTRQAEMVERFIIQSREAHAQGRNEVALQFAITAQRHGQIVWLDLGDPVTLRRRSRQLEAEVTPLVKQATALAAKKKDPYIILLAQRSQGNLQLSRGLDDDARLREKAELLESARVHAEMVLSALDREGFARHRVERMLNSVADAMSHASKAAEEKKSLRWMVREGRTTLAQADRKLKEGDVETARVLGWKAHRIAQRTISSSLGPLDKAKISDAIVRTEKLLERAGNVTSARSRALCVRARTRQKEARAMLEKGELRGALARTRVAARMIQDAIELDRRPIQRLR
jgi:hypothetical protein